MLSVVLAIAVLLSLSFRVQSLLRPLSGAATRQLDDNGYFCGTKWYSGSGLLEEEDHDNGATNSEDGSLKVCLDDMCVEAGSRRVVAEEADVERGRNEYSSDHKHFCNEAEASHVRLLVVPIVPAFHGSTAFEQLIMSSAHVGTLCSAGTWQCEGQWIRKHFGSENLLGTYSNYWNLSKGILIDKMSNLSTFPSKSQGCPLDGTYLSDALIKPFEKSDMPEAMASVGIDTLKVVYVILWRPLCLALLSSNSHDNENYAARELCLLKQALHDFHFLRNGGHRVMLLNVGDVLWKRSFTKQRLQSAMPCLGDIAFDFVPELHRDVSPCNKWKTHSSIQAFADMVDPLEDFGYNVNTMECMGEKHSIVRHLGDKRRTQLQEVMNELSELSRL